MKCENWMCSKTPDEGETACREHGGKYKIKSLQEAIEILSGFEYCHFSSGCPHDLAYDGVMEFLEKAKSQSREEK